MGDVNCKKIQGGMSIHLPRRRCGTPQMPPDQTLITPRTNDMEFKVTKISKDCLDQDIEIIMILAIENLFLMYCNLMMYLEQLSNDGLDINANVIHVSVSMLPPVNMPDKDSGVVHVVNIPLLSSSYAAEIIHGTAGIEIYEAMISVSNWYRTFGSELQHAIYWYITLAESYWMIDHTSHLNPRTSFLSQGPVRLATDQEHVYFVFIVRFALIPSKKLMPMCFQDL
ncbi:hypothetical protein EDD85DRAFT_794180 [Armillaria nabsnona]|nr:hypothetical protein EDD85DRAFT_794180 [Armillaria nabsnona]